VSAISPPLGHDDVVHGLWRAADLGRLPHALLLEGVAGIGKFRAALWLVQGLFCDARGMGEGPCGRCGPCRRVAARSHPDLFVLDPLELELESIPIGAIVEREDDHDPVCNFLALRAMEGGLRAVVVREFERANVQAQNALLKTLEEPGASTLLLLETSRADLLLDTVRSRCVNVRFEGLSPEQTREILSTHGLTGQRAETLARWAGGSPGRALALERGGAVEMRELLGEVLSGKCDPFEATERLLELPGEFGGKTPTAQVRGRVRAALDLCSAILRDGLRSCAGVGCAELPHGDLVLAHPRSEAFWRGAQQLVVALRGEVELNLPPEGLLDRALLVLGSSRSVAPNHSS
jgi:DNA polymerase III delta' subunit